MRKMWQKINLKNQKGSITLFVTILMIFFVIMGAMLYINSQNKNIQQSEQVAKIQSEYNATTSKLEEKYEEIIEKGTQNLKNTVTYNYKENGGTSADKESERLLAGTTVNHTVIKADKPGGYEFVGWNTNKDATVGLTGELKMPNEDITLYAIYKKDIVVTFHYYNKQSSTISKTIYNKAKEISITTPAINNATINGTLFIQRGWGVNNNAGELVTIPANSSINISDDTTYYASYSANITITYNANGGANAPGAETKTVYMNYMGTTSLIEINKNTPTKTGYTFKSWNTAPNGSGTSYTAGQSIKLDTNVTFYAMYEINYYKITYDNNYYNNNLWTNTEDLNYWNYASTGPSSKTSITDNTVLNGKISKFIMKSGTAGGPYYQTPRLPEGKQYTWSIYIKSNTTKTLAIGQEQGGQITVKVTPEWQKFTHTFTTNSNQYYAFTIYATEAGNNTWTEGEEIYIHSLEIMEGTPTHTIQSKAYNSTLGTLPTPTRTGYNFQGWYTAPTGGTQISSTTIVPANNVTYYARWKDNIAPTIKNLIPGKILLDRNSTSIYNNSNNGNVALSKDANTGLTITTTGAASPAHGGFTFANKSYANAEFLTVIVAKIPTGYTINFNSNAYGDGGTATWLTGNQGTGNWKTYLCKVTCGSTGTFSTTNYFYLAGGSVPTTSNPLVWYAKEASLYEIVKNWVNTSVTVHIVGSDEGSRIDHFEWYEGSAWTSRAISNYTGSYDPYGYITYIGEQGNITMKYRAIDRAGNISNEYSTNFKKENTAPTVTVSPTSATACRSKSVKITVADTGGSGLASNSYQYYLSTSSTGFAGGAWTNYTSGTAFTIGSGKTGTYYLWVKRIKDNAGNLSSSNNQTVSSVVYHRYGTYVFDNTAPTMGIGTTVNYNARAGKTLSYTNSVTTGTNASVTYPAFPGVNFTVNFTTNKAVSTYYFKISTQNVSNYDNVTSHDRYGAWSNIAANTTKTTTTNLTSNDSTTNKTYYIYAKGVDALGNVGYAKRTFVVYTKYHALVQRCYYNAFDSFRKYGNTDWLGWVTESYNIAKGISNGTTIEDWSRFNSTITSNNKYKAYVDVMYGLLYSPAMGDYNLDAWQYVTKCYRVIFFREPDSAGLQSWGNLVNNQTYTPRTVIYALAGLETGNYATYGGY